MENKETMRITIDHDIYCDNPRTENDGMWTFACWHKRYSMGDIQPEECMSEFISALPKGTIIKPLYMMDHSIQTISLGSFSDQWDSGTLGIVYLTPEKLKDEFPDDPNAEAKAAGYLDGEVSEYNNWLHGECYVLTIEEWEGCEHCGRGEWTTVDRCGEFLGETFDECGFYCDVEAYGLSMDDVKAAWENCDSGE